MTYNGIAADGTMTLTGANTELSGTISAGACRDEVIVSALGSNWDGSSGMFTGQLAHAVIFDGTFGDGTVVFNIGTYADTSALQATITAHK